MIYFRNERVEENFCGTPAFEWGIFSDTTAKNTLLSYLSCWSIQNSFILSSSTLTHVSPREEFIIHQNAEAQSVVLPRNMGTVAVVTVLAIVVMKALTNSTLQNPQKRTSNSDCSLSYVTGCRTAPRGPATTAAVALATLHNSGVVP